ncbi:MAG: hypothetical protein ACI9TY_001507 [Alphaproteobacteria bacterium]|jgi:hypothetical protein
MPSARESDTSHDKQKNTCNKKSARLKNSQYQSIKNKIYIVKKQHISFTLISPREMLIDKLTN